MTLTIQTEEWYQALVDDCRDIITEAVFIHRWSLVEGYHQLGERIVADNNFQEFAKGNKSSVQDLARNLGISERTLYYAIQFYELFPDLALLPEGKDITWYKIIVKYLTTPRPIPELPIGKYQTIIIDPPWPIEKIEREVAPNQHGYDYPTMTIDEIKQLVLPTADNCHLYLWTTQKYLPVSFEVLEGWGLKYIFTMVWHKSGGFQPFNLPQYNCEFILFGRKGSLDFLDTKNFFTCFEGRRREHSRKPIEFYNLVRRVSPEPRIDIFSREKQEGFNQFGNEVDKFNP